MMLLSLGFDTQSANVIQDLTEEYDESQTNSSQEHR